MGHSQLRACQRRSLFLLVLSLHTKISLKMVDNVETTTPTVEEVASNGESETATEEVSAAVAAENGSNGTHEAEKNGEETKEAESTNGAEAEESKEEAAPEADKEAEAKEDEATKRKADAPSEDETSEKIAKLKESAAEVVTEAEKKLPEEPLT